MEQYGLSLSHARTLTGDLRLADLYEKVAAVDPVLSATWVADTLLGELYYRGLNIADVPIPQFIGLLELLKEGSITDKGGVEVLRVLLDQAAKHEPIEVPSVIVGRLNLGRTASDEFIPLAREVLAMHQAAVEDYQKGKKGALNFLVGQMMKKTRGRADPRELGEILESLITSQFSGE